MTTERLEFRLDREHRRKLEALAEKERATLSDTIRTLIDRAYEAEARARKAELVQELAAMNVEDVPDPEELTGQLENKYGLDRLP